MLRAGAAMGDGAHEDGAAQGDRAAQPDPVTAGELLRQALVDDADPRFPRWLPLPGIALAATWTAYQVATAGADPLATLLWPGAAIFGLTTLAAWFGWQLEID